MIKVSETPGKTSPAKKTITLKDVDVNTLHLEDEDGDLTPQLLEALPEDIDTLDFKITIELD